MKYQLLSIILASLCAKTYDQCEIKVVENILNYNFNSHFANLCEKNEKNISIYIVPLLKNCAFMRKSNKIKQNTKVYHFHLIDFNKTIKIDHFAISFGIEYEIVFLNLRKNANFHIKQMTDTVVNSHGTLF